MSVEPDHINRDKKGFRVILVWSIAVFFGFILIGYLFRLINPTELHLHESEYLEKMYVTERTEVILVPAENARFLGYFEPGSILYVLDRDKNYARVRPFRVSEFDSVWVDTTNLAEYAEESYRRWAREYERNVVRELQER